MGERRHEARVVTVGDRSAEIDLELVDLIEALWMLGIDTSFSCQGQFGPPHAPLPEPWGYIMFPDVEDLRAFLVCFDNTPLSSRRFAQRHEWNPEAETRTPAGPPSWELRGGVRPPEDAEDDDNAEDALESNAPGAASTPAAPGTPGFRFIGLARFPQADLAEMTQIMQLHAQQQHLPTPASRG